MSLWSFLMSKDRPIYVKDNRKNKLIRVAVRFYFRGVK